MLETYNNLKEKKEFEVEGNGRGRHGEGGGGKRGLTLALQFTEL